MAAALAEYRFGDVERRRTVVRREGSMLLVLVVDGVYIILSSGNQALVLVVTSVSGVQFLLLDSICFGRSMELDVNF